MVTFMGLVQYCFENSATKPKSDTLVAYPVHAILLLLSVRRSRTLIENRYTLVEFLREGCIGELLQKQRSGTDEQMSVYGFTYSKQVQSENVVSITLGSKGPERRMDVLHQSVKAVGEPLQQSELKAIFW